MSVLVPQLETTRLTLREWRATDFDAYASIAADRDVMRYVGGPLDPALSWRQMAAHAGHWALRGYGNWALERTADGVLLGRVGLWNPEGWPGLEIGWMLARQAWGNGYATEGANAAMDWAWSVLNADRLISVIHHENTASLAVAQRLGLNMQHEETVNGQRCIIYGACRPS